MDISVARRPHFLKPEDGELLTAAEAERLVQDIQQFSIPQIGSQKWMKQQNALEKLNLQAHYNALAHADEFVLAALISYEKLPVVIHELLAIEVWKEEVFPLIAERMAKESSSITTYLILYHELTIVNLLEVLMFHREACEGAGQDALLELADYCHRKMVYLNTQASADSAFKERNAEELMRMTAEEDLQDKVATVRFNCGLCALSILRYLTDNVVDFPLCIMTRMLSTNDEILTLVPLLETPPWSRRRTHHGRNVLEKYEDGKWQEVLPADFLRVTKYDAQVWLALNNLLVDPQCRAKYTLDSFRRDRVLKLKKHMNEVLLDQLPVLSDLRRVLEEAALMIAPSIEAVKASRLILEQVPEIRDGLLRSCNWAEVAETQMANLFKDSPASRQAIQARMQDMLNMFDFEEMLEAPKCAACGSPAVQRCSRCKHEWYCGRECQVAVWKRHKPLCNVIATSIPASRKE